MDNTIIKQFLKDNADEKYASFSSSLIPNCTTMYGVRIPILRKFAKEIAKGDVEEYLKNALDDSFEEIMLQGLVIGYSKLSIEEVLSHFRDFIPKIKDWSINDGVCNSLKIVKKHREETWNFLMRYRFSDSEFEQRVVAVMLLSHFLVDDYIDRVLNVFNELKHEGYYRMMGVAWGIQAAYVKYPDKVLTFLKNNDLDDVTYNKAIQKITESLKVSKEEKDMLRKMKR